jgi:hypothetical protein
MVRGALFSAGGESEPQRAEMECWQRKMDEAVQTREAL